MSHSEDYFRSPPRRRVGVLAVIRSGGGVLLVDKVYRQDRSPNSWGLVGGSVMEYELPLAAWRREVAGETGLDLHPGRLLAVDYVPATETGAEGYNLVYDGGTIASDTKIVLPEHELAGYGFIPPEALDLHLTAHSTRRTRAALEALATGTTADLVLGYPAAEYRP
ncbi:NUDIX hydrolase [Streptomyces sp. NBC_01317]|uniref:NUDIX hydrolase n=1 Tax=Streptomyces sp. NBC_01317 TaxID=2903822 RepID=UPI002E11A077|nr:NUDIX hydrolase [Streptomyces sp. NBC_01317]